MTADRPIELAWYLAELQRFVRALDGAPSWHVARVVDGLSVHPADVRRIARASLVGLEAYESRFRELVTSGCPWINLSAIGLLDGALIISVERSPDRHATRTASVNLSGAATFVRAIPGWDLSDILELVG